MIEKEVVRRGMTLRETARRSGVKYSALQPSLHGKRKLRVPEYLALCAMLNLNPRGYRD